MKKQQLDFQKNTRIQKKKNDDDEEKEREGEEEPEEKEEETKKSSSNSNNDKKLTNASPPTLAWLWFERGDTLEAQSMGAALEVVLTAVVVLTGVDGAGVGLEEGADTRLG